MGQLYATSIHHNSKIIVDAPSLKDWQYSLNKRCDCCMVNPYNANEIIFWQGKRISESLKNAKILRYNVKIRKNMCIVYHNSAIKDIYQHMVSAKSISTNRYPLKDVGFIFTKMLKYPFGDNLVMVFGCMILSCNTYKSPFCVLIDATTMKVIHVTMLSINIQIDNHCNYVVYKNIIFTVYTNTVRVFIINQVDYNCKTNDPGINTSHTENKNSNSKLMDVVVVRLTGWRGYYDQSRSFLVKFVTKHVKDEIHLQLLLFSPNALLVFMDSFQLINVTIKKKQLSCSSTSGNSDGNVNCDNMDDNYNDTCGHDCDYDHEKFKWNPRAFKTKKISVSCSLNDRSTDLLQLGFKTSNKNINNYNDKFIQFVSKKTFYDVCCHCINNRYLIITGGSIYTGKHENFDDSDKLNNEIILFDFERKTWQLLKDKYSLTLPRFYKQIFSLSVKDKIYSFGDVSGHNKFWNWNMNNHNRDVNVTSNITRRCVLSLKLVVPIWKMERLIWISYQKENTNFALLPKCIVQKILQYAKWSILEDGNRFT